MAVFPVRCWYPLKHTIRKTILIQDLGDGHEQRISKNAAFSRADGQGSGVSSYKGINVFEISIRNLQYISGDITAKANALWNFYIGADGPLVAFYFYNPAENTGDPGIAPLNAGTDPIGRYLVRFQDADLSRDLFVRMLYNHSITLIEVRA